MEEACEALSGRQQVGGDTDVYLPLVTGGANGGAVVTYLGLDQSAAQAELISDSQVSSTDWQSTAMPAPIMMEIDVPNGNWDREKPFMARGPGGPIRVHLPPDARPGTKVTCKLAPKPEFRVQVPPGAKPGWIIKFQKANGEEVAVGVPPGLQPGDTFDVTPPALMVRVPENAKPGDGVVFTQITGIRKDGTGGRREVFRARVPEGCQPLDHFSALLPAPPQVPPRPE